MTKNIEKLTHRLNSLNEKISKNEKRLEVLKAREQLEINRERMNAKKNQRKRTHRLIVLGAAIQTIFPRLVEHEDEELAVRWVLSIAKAYKSSHPKNAEKLAKSEKEASGQN